MSLNRDIVAEYPQLSSLDYYYGNGKFSVKSVGRIAGLEIAFRGIAEINPQTPRGWNFKFVKKNILIIWAESTREIGTLVFGYQGDFEIKYVMGAGWHGQRIIGTENNNYISYWNAMNSNWDQAGNWANYKFGYKYGRIVMRSSIIAPQPILEEEQITEDIPVGGESPAQEGGGAE